MWDPKTLAAKAAPDGRFTIAIGELDYDDPFSAIISYDPRFSQPWSRVDVAREIVDITYLPFGQGELAPVALSTEGDVYFLQDSIVRQKIPGTGVSSDDADGRGQVWRIVTSGQELWVIGENGQIWIGAQNEWRPVTPPNDALDIVALASMEGEILISGNMKKTAASPFDGDIDYSTISPEDFLAALSEQNEAVIDATGQTQAAFYAYEDGEWTEFHGLVDGSIRSLSATARDEIIACGWQALLLSGAKQTLEKLVIPPEAQTVLSAAIWHDEIWFASDYALFKMVNDETTRVRLELGPTLPRRKMAPFKIEVSGNKLVYFDYSHDPKIWNGEVWEDQPIPFALKQREFDADSAL